MKRRLQQCFVAKGMSLPSCPSRSYLTTDGQSANLPWCQYTIKARDQFFFLLENFLRELRVCYFMEPYLTRGRICCLLLLLGLASAVPLGSECRGTFVPILETPPTNSDALLEQIAAGLVGCNEGHICASLPLFRCCTQD
jgi:hypothetical protein